jgi:glycosyltransferase involved in cell wall biosynthesis
VATTHPVDGEAAVRAPEGGRRNIVKVLTLIDAFRLGGAEALVAQLARLAPDAGFELDVLSLSPPSPERSKMVPALEAAGLVPRYLGVRRLLDPAAQPALVRAIRASGCDVVHAHLGMAITLGVPAATLAGRKAICTFHTVDAPEEPRGQVRERLAVGVATRSFRTIFVSHASRQAFADRYRPRRMPPNWIVLHNGVDIGQFTPAAVPPAPLPGVPAHHGPTVTVLSAQRAFKGIEVLVRAWPAIRAAVPDARLLLVGDGAERPALERRVAELDLTDSVVFAGVRNDVVAVLQAADLVVLPSLEGENLPTVLMEAGACGRPVVSTNVGGIPDIVRHGTTGLLVPPADPAALAAAVNRLLRSPDERARMGRAARSHIAASFDGRVWATNLKVLYDEASGSSRSSRARTAA